MWNPNFQSGSDSSVGRTNSREGQIGMGLWHECSHRRHFVWLAGLFTGTEENSRYSAMCRAWVHCSFIEHECVCTYSHICEFMCIWHMHIFCYVSCMVALFIYWTWNSVDILLCVVHGCIVHLLNTELYLQLFLFTVRFFWNFVSYCYCKVIKLCWNWNIRKGFLYNFEGVSKFELLLFTVWFLEFFFLIFLKKHCFLIPGTRWFNPVKTKILERVLLFSCGHSQYY